jgi:hypothetical protein
VVDFRYHALSLVAVFLALGIGIVLGVTVGDSLVSEADQNLRDSLRDDVTEAREEARTQEALGSRREAVIDEAAPFIGEGRLRGTRTAFVALGDLPGNVADNVEEAVESAGGELTRTLVLSPPEFPRVRGRGRAERDGRAWGRLIESGGAFLRRARSDERDRVSGNPLAAVDTVVVYRDPPDDADDEEAARSLELREAFEDGLLDGLPNDVIGVEAMDTEPSQVGWYEDRLVANVDNADVAAGRLALVLLVEEAVLAAITGDRPEGSYGYKDTADRALPDLSD